MSKSREIKTSAYIYLEGEGVTKSDMLSLIAEDINVLNSIIDKNKDSAVSSSIELAKYQRAVMLQTQRELSAYRCSDYRDTIINMLENGNTEVQKVFFKDVFNLEVTLSHDVDYHRGVIRASTVELDTADGHSLFLQKTDTRANDLYTIGETSDELYYYEPDEMEFIKENLEVCDSVYAVLDESIFFEAISDDPEFIDELARHMCADAAGSNETGYIDDLDENE